MTRPSMKPNHSRNFRIPSNFLGYTLIELLVVIVIIAVLAAITFSVTVRIRKSAHQAITTSNLRQIGVALITFTTEKGRFPGRFADPIWDRAIMPHLGYTEPLLGAGEMKRSQYPALEAAAKVFHTPEDRAERDPSVYPRSFAIIPWTTNYGAGGSIRGWKDRPANVGIPYAALTDPQKSAMVVTWFSGTESNPNYLGRGAHGYHDKGGPAGALGNFQQVLFADGHIEKISADISTKEFVQKYWPGSIEPVN